MPKRKAEAEAEREPDASPEEIFEGLVGDTSLLSRRLRVTETVPCRRLRGTLVPASTREKVCPPSTFGRRVTDFFEGCVYRNGVVIRKILGAPEYNVKSTTVCAGKHVTNFHVRLDAKGKIVPCTRNVVNCFALGYMDLYEQEYIDFFFEELSRNSRSESGYWDKIELQ